MPVATRADKISHGLCLFLCYPYTFAMIPFFALVPGVVIEKLTPYLYKIKLKRVIITANHDRLKLCHDREVPEWAQKLPISLPNIIILGVHPVLLFTEDVNAPANCGKYLSQLR
jgi:hypothetical protein